MMSLLFCILDFYANWWILCTWSAIETKKNSYKNVNIIDELRLPQSSLLLWHNNWVMIETLKIPTKYPIHLVHPLIETLKISLKLTFSLPTLNCPSHDKVLPCQTTIICIYVFFPRGVELDYFSPKKIHPITQPDSGTYNEASGNVGQQGHISIPSLSVVKEFFQLFFQQLLSCGNSLTLKAFAKRVQATLHGRMTSSWMKIIHSTH